MPTAGEAPARCSQCDVELGVAHVLLVHHCGEHRIPDGFCNIEHMSDWAKAGGRWKCTLNTKCWPPEARTEAAREMKATKAYVYGEVYPHELGTKYWFQYGKKGAWESTSEHTFGIG